jgi:hypothetical protein
MALFQFHGGRSALMLPASNEQAIAEIDESLGLGLDQYVAERKVTMLMDPLAYLTDRNMALGTVITNIGTDYANEIRLINNMVPDGYKNTPWVRQMAADTVRLKGLANLKKVDIQYPIEKAAYKAQKKKNQRNLAEKKELVEEGA